MSSFWGEMSWLEGSVQVPPTCSRTVVISCACVCVCAAFQGVIPAFFAAQTTHSKLSPCATCLHLLNRSERSIRHMNKDFLCIQRLQLASFCHPVHFTLLVHLSKHTVVDEFVACRFFFCFVTLNTLSEDQCDKDGARCSSNGPYSLTSCLQTLLSCLIWLTSHEFSEELLH